MDLKNAILSTGNRLTSEELDAGGLNAGPALRNLQTILSNYKTESPYLNFLAFFLSIFIDDLYYNLSGDFPYDEASKQKRDGIFRDIGQLLVKLSDLLNSEDGVKLYAIYISLVEKYTDGLGSLNNAGTSDQ